MNANADIRPATLADASSVADIYNHYVATGGATFATKPVTTEDVESMMSVGGTDGWYVASRSSDPQVLGWASARSFSDRYGYRLSCETAIYLSPQAVGAGIADPLQERIHRHCIENGLHHAMAKIITTNERSIQFHLRHGYTLVGVQNEIGHMDGKWLDVTILQKLFPAGPEHNDGPAP